MELKDIKAIIDLMKKHSVTEFELERDDFKIKLRRGSTKPGNGTEEGSPAVVVAQPAQPALPGAGGSPGAAGAPPPTDPEITAPMIGTFYRAPSPDSESYIEVGMEVNPETVVCIIEAMKVMNEIKSEISGVVTEVLAENAKPVEFGQPLFRVRPHK